MDALTVKDLSRKFGVSEDFASLLVSRGLTDEKEVQAFLHPSLADMCSPFSIDGMQEAVDRIKLAIEKQEKILIFGDYDCDGISAVSILMLYLRDKTPSDYFIPDRNVDGYGLTTTAVDGIIKKKRPDLVITVDCGITSHREVNYLKERNIDIIVTDHHEPQEVLPNCIVVDPKVAKKGFCGFCGAGVALKLVEALSSRAEIEQYLDIAALATVADVVPLEKDNRIIAYFGLKQMQEHPRKGLKMLVGEDGVTSYGIMFRIAPRINAAGRLSSAMKVVDLFLSDDYFMLKMLVEELEKDNARRQSICESVVSEAKAMLHSFDYDTNRIICLAKDDWEIGVLGIAAARLVEEFKCPTVLFGMRDGLLRGSARSIKSVNIFELFSSLSGYFEAFGGHAQAAGVTIKESNLDAFRADANAILLKTHSDDEFVLKYSYDAVLDINKPLLPFAKELDMLEPMGYGNPKPVFLVKGDGLRFDRLAYTNHIKYASKNCELLGFSCLNVLGATRGNADYEITLSRNVFQNNEYAQGVIKSIKINEVNLSDDEARLLNLHQLKYDEDGNLPLIDAQVAEEYMTNRFGTLLVCFDKSEYDALCNVMPSVKDLNVFVGSTPCLNTQNCVLIAPCNNFDFGFYKRVIVAGAPLNKGYLTYIADSSNVTFALENYASTCVVVSDNVLRDVYKELGAFVRRGERASSPQRVLNSVQSRIRVTDYEFFVAWQIFEELGLIVVGERGRLDVQLKHVELAKSPTYRSMRK